MELLFSLREFRLGSRGPVTLWEKAVQFQFGGLRLCSFVFILDHWLHIGPVPGATLGCLWGPRGLPKGARRLPRDNPRRPKPFPWSASGLPLGAGPPEGRRGPQGGNPGDPKGASRCRGAQFFKKHSKTMSITLRINVHAVEARSPYWSKEGAGRTRITR